MELILQPKLPKQTLNQNPVGLLDRDGGSKVLSLQLEDILFSPMGLKINKSNLKTHWGFSAAIKTNI